MAYCTLCSVMVVELWYFDHAHFIAFRMCQYQLLTHSGSFKQTTSVHNTLYMSSLSYRTPLRYHCAIFEFFIELHALELTKSAHPGLY